MHRSTANLTSSNDDISTKEASETHQATFSIWQETVKTCP
jgi:hypothetical protein